MDRVESNSRYFAEYIRQIISIHREEAPCAESSGASNYRRGFSARAAAGYVSDIDFIPGISPGIGIGDSVG